MGRDTPAQERYYQRMVTAKKKTKTTPKPRDTLAQQRFQQIPSNYEKAEAIARRVKAGENVNVADVLWVSKHYPGMLMSSAVAPKKKPAAKPIQQTMRETARTRGMIQARATKTPTIQRIKEKRGLVPSKAEKTSLETMFKTIHETPVPKKGIAEQMMDYARRPLTPGEKIVAGIVAPRMTKQRHIDVAAGVIAPFEKVAYTVGGAVGLKTPRPPPTLTGGLVGSTTESIAGKKQGISLNLKKHLLGTTPEAKAIQTTMRIPDRGLVTSQELSRMAEMGPAYAAGTVIGDIFISFGVGKATQKMATKVQTKTESWLTKKYVEKGPLQWKGLKEKVAMHVTGVKPSLARGEISIPVAEKMGVFGREAVPKGLPYTDIGWKLTQTPRMGGVMITKVPTTSAVVGKSLPLYFGVGKDLFAFSEAQAYETRLSFEGGEPAKTFKYEKIKHLGSFDRRLSTLSEYIRHQKILPFTTQAQVTRAGIHPFIPKIITKTSKTFPSIFGIAHFGLKIPHEPKMLTEPKASTLIGTEKFPSTTKLSAKQPSAPPISIAKDSTITKSVTPKKKTIGINIPTSEKQMKDTLQRWRFTPSIGSVSRLKKRDESIPVVASIKVPDVIAEETEDTTPVMSPIVSSVQEELVKPIAEQKLLQRLFEVPTIKTKQKQKTETHLTPITTPTQLLTLKDPFTPYTPTRQIPPEAPIPLPFILRERKKKKKRKKKEKYGEWWLRTHPVGKSIFLPEDFDLGV